jgi:hypothetical protein
MKNGMNAILDGAMVAFPFGFSRLHLNEILSSHPFGVRSGRHPASSIG